MGHLEDSLTAFVLVENGKVITTGQARFVKECSDIKGIVTNHKLRRSEEKTVGEYTCAPPSLELTEIVAENVISIAGHQVYYNLEDKERHGIKLITEKAPDGAGGET